MLRGEVLKNREMMLLLLKLQSENALSAEQKNQLSQEIKARADDAAKRLAEPKDSFDSAMGKELRQKLVDLANTAKSVQIDAKTGLDDVNKVLDAVKAGKDLILDARKKAIEQYQSAISQLPNDAKKALASSVVSVEQLKSLGVDKLKETLGKLDPSLSAEALQAMQIGAVANRIFSEYTKNGVPTPELIAGLGFESLKQIVPQLNNPLVETVVKAAQTVTDVHRAGADFAAFAVTTMQAAFSTGNPYVIAAAAIIVALIALFKFVFGKGGGGDGDGDGPDGAKGAGSKGRIGGAGDPGKQPGDKQVAQNGDTQLGEDGVVVGPTENPTTSTETPLGTTKDGKYLVARNGNVILVREKEKGEKSEPMMRVDVTTVMRAGTNAGLTGSVIKEVSGVSPDGLGLWLVATEKLALVMEGKTWQIIDDPVFVRDGTVAPNQYGHKIEDVGKRVLTYKGGKKLHDPIVVTDIYMEENGAVVPAGVSSATKVNEFKEGDNKVFLTIQKKGKSLDVYLVKKGGKWMVERDEAPSENK